MAATKSVTVKTVDDRKNAYINSILRNSVYMIDSIVCQTLKQSLMKMSADDLRNLCYICRQKEEDMLVKTSKLFYAWMHRESSVVGFHRLENDSPSHEDIQMAAMTWKNVDCKILRYDNDGWIKVMIMTTIPYVIFARKSELKRKK